MKVIQLNSASVIVEDNGVNVLCDPWLTGREYYGSWAMMPEYDFKPDDFKKIDFIYISHIHSDHFSTQTLEYLDKDIPVLIHNFSVKFLKKGIENSGFKVIELKNNSRFKLKGDFNINIFSANACNPTVCGKVMGCGIMENEYKITQIDTMALFDNGKQVIVNTNDSPFEIADQTATRIKQLYPNIDLLLVGYVAASSWPQCYAMSSKEKLEAADKKEYNKLHATRKFIELLQPKHYLPFAGRYVLSGSNLSLNKYRGEPDLEYAFEWLKMFVSPKYQGVLINNDSWFDIDTGKSNIKYIPMKQIDKKIYLKSLGQNEFTYQSEPFGSSDDLVGLIDEAYENFEKIRKEIGWDSKTKIYIIT